jgi:hypothetical protein
MAALYVVRLSLRTEECGQRWSRFILSGISRIDDLGNHQLKPMSIIGAVPHARSVIRVADLFQSAPSAL